MRVIALLTLLLIVAGCVSAAKPVPRAPTGAPRPACAIPPPPTYPDTDAALAAAPGLIGRDALLAEGRDVSRAYIGRLRDAMAHCR